MIWQERQRSHKARINDAIDPRGLTADEVFDQLDERLSKLATTSNRRASSFLSS